jgi:hypothetical protein
MRHATPRAKGLLPALMVLAPVGRALVPAACSTALNSVSQLPALHPAVALPAIVPQADPEGPVTLEAFDLDEIDWIRARHAAGEAGLDKPRRECEALFVYVVELPPHCVDGPVALGGAAGHSRLTRRERNLSRGQSPRLRRGLRCGSLGMPCSTAGAKGLRGPDTRDRVGGR